MLLLSQSTGCVKYILMQPFKVVFPIITQCNRGLLIDGQMQLGKLLVLIHMWFLLHL